MFYQLFLLFLGGNILQTILAELTNLPSSYDLLQAFKQNIREKGSQVAVSEQLNHGSLDVMATSTTNWVVSSGFSDKTCSTLATTQGFRTDCLKDAAKTSIRVSCNSTTITLDEYFYSTTCKGKVSSRTVAKTSTCLSTQFTGETLSYACITSPNDPPLPTGDWFTFISYADYTCSQKDIFYGWKNGVCLNSLGSSSMKYSYPTLYSYSSSSTCSGTSSTSDLSSLTATCNKNYAGSSSHYYYLHSDGSTVSTTTPTAQPTLRPSTSTKTTKPTAKSASKPTMKPSASKPSTTVKPSTSKPTLKTTIKPTARNGPTVKPTPKPTFKPTTKNMAIDGNTSSSDSESTPSNSLSHYDNDSSHVMVILSVCLGVLVVGLLLWHCCRREHEDHKNTGQYVKVTRNEEKWDNISEIPEIL